MEWTTKGVAGSGGMPNAPELAQALIATAQATTQAAEAAISQASAGRSGGGEGSGVVMS